MGWIIAALGIVFGLVNPQVGLLIFVIGLIVTILSNTSSSRPAPASAKSLGALVMLIVGAVVFMMLVAAIVGAAGSL